MKKTLSIILAILMIVTTIPFAFAAEDDYVAAITIDGETTYYETFPDVRNLYRNTEITIDLLADVEYVFKCGYSIAKPWVINLNGHTMTAISNNGAILSMGYNAVVTLNGPGKLINAGTNPCTIYVDSGGFVIGGEEAPEISNEIRIRDITAGYITVNTPLSNAQYLISVNNKVASYPSKAFIFAGEGVDLSTDWFEPKKTDVCRKLTKTKDGICFSENVEHNKIQVDAKAPTCIENGWNAYEYCSDCKYTTYVKLPASHNIVTVDAKAPTCTEIGWDAYEYCTACDYTTYNEIPATNHKDTLVQVDAKAKTCTEIGWDAYEYCTACDYTTYNEIPASHEIVKVDAQAVSCTAIGWDAYEYCTACDYTTYNEIPATNHKDTLVKVDAKAPTCTEIGWDAYEYCTECDYTTYVEIPVVDHEDADNDGVCDICGEQLICPDCDRPAHEETGVAMFICLLIGLFKLIYTFVTSI